MSSKVSAYLSSAQFVQKFEHLQQPQISLLAKNTLETKSGLKLSNKTSHKTNKTSLCKKKEMLHTTSFIWQNCSVNRHFANKLLCPILG